MKAYKALITLLTVGLLVACGQPGTRNGIGPQNRAHETVDGTGDWGGGNGIDNRVIEKYAIDITTLPEFKEILEPIGEHLMSIPDEDEESEKPDTNTFKVFAGMRTWIFAPVNLDVIEKKRIGVDFSKDPIDQLAIQSDQEVWVDSRKYAKMSKEDKAGLLLHEMMMINYRLRFLDLAKYCLAVKSCGDGGSIEELLKNNPDFAKKMEPEAKRELNREDYQFIRGATAFLLTKWKDLKTKSDMKWFAKTFNFDKRMTGDDEEDNHSDVKFEIDAKKVKTAIEALGMNSLYCDFSKDGKDGKICDVSGKMENTRLTLSRFDRKTKKLSEMKLIMSTDIHSGEGAERCPAGGGYCVGVDILEDWTSYPKMGVGTQLVAGVVYLLVAYEDKTAANMPIVNSIILRNAVVAFEKHTEEQQGRLLSVVPTETGIDFAMSIALEKEFRREHTDFQYEKKWAIWVPDFMKK